MTTQKTSQSLAKGCVPVYKQNGKLEVLRKRPENGGLVAKYFSKDCKAIIMFELDTMNSNLLKALRKEYPAIKGINDTWRIFYRPIQVRYEDGIHTGDVVYLFAQIEGREGNIKQSLQDLQVNEKKEVSAHMLSSGPFILRSFASHETDFQEQVFDALKKHDAEVNDEIFSEIRSSLKQFNDKLLSLEENLGQVKEDQKSSNENLEKLINDANKKNTRKSCQDEEYNRHHS